MQLEYKMTGESKKKTLLFVHGAGASARQFEDQHTYFSENFKVVSLSLRGHGDSPLPEPNVASAYDLNVLADDIMALIVKLDLNDIHYIGNSAGGVLGYIVCSKMPERFLSLITFGTTGKMNFPKFTTKWVGAYDAFMIKYFEKKYLNFLTKYSSKNDLARPIIHTMFQASVKAIPFIRIPLARYDYLNTIEHLKVPYKLIQCEHDKDINRTLKSTYSAMSKNPKTAVITLKGAGHLANLDNPEAFNKCLETILGTGV